MATKRTSRRGESGTPAPTPTVSTPRQRPPSPLSPARTSRVDEKRQMQDLNNRLVSYVEAVRRYQADVQNLQSERQTIEETHTTELKTIKTMYKDELDQVRKAIDAISKEKAKLEIDAEKGSRDAREAKSELAEEKRRRTKAEKELGVAIKRLADIEVRFNEIEDEVRYLRPENVKLAKRLEDAKKNLEDETLQRTDLNNKLLTLQENMKFENSMLEQQLNETRIRKHVEISEIDGRLNQEYEEKLQEKINELRATYEQHSRENREQFNRVYDEKIAALQEKLTTERLNQAGNVQELRDLSTKVSTLTTKNFELESSNGALQKRMADLMKNIDEKEAHFRSAMARKDGELSAKEEQMQTMLKDYEDLMEIKVVLDMEIATYRKLLEGEEKRLGLSPSGSPEQLAGSARGVKRRRTYIEEEDVFGMVSDHSGQGNVQIEPLEKGSKWIKLINKNDTEINIGGWVLTNTSGTDEATYKFHRSTNLAPGATCTIYSSDSDQEHSPPTSLVMKKGGWVIGSTNKTVLANKDGDEEACRLSREQRTTGSSYSSGYGSVRTEHEKSCILM